MRLSDCMKQESLQQLYAQICIKLDKTTSFQIWGLQLYFLIHFKTSQVQLLSRKANPGEISSIALEQYPWSTILWTIRQALLWGKFCCDGHSFCHANSMADAWVDWKYLGEDPSLLKGHWAKHNYTVHHHMLFFQLTCFKSAYIEEIRYTPHLEKRLSEFQHPLGYPYVCHVISFLETLLCLPAPVLARFYFYHFSLWLTF